MMNTSGGWDGLLVLVSLRCLLNSALADTATLVWGTFRSCCGDDSGNLEPGTKAGNGSLPGCATPIAFVPGES